MVSLPGAKHTAFAGLEDAAAATTGSLTLPFAEKGRFIEVKPLKTMGITVSGLADAISGITF
jgi:hypothetical protein